MSRDPTPVVSVSSMEDGGEEARGGAEEGREGGGTDGEDLDVVDNGLVVADDEDLMVAAEDFADGCSI